MPSPTQKFAMFRSAARYLTEPHPFSRNPITVKPHAVDFSVYPKRAARTGAVYVSLLLMYGEKAFTDQVSESSLSCPSSWAGLSRQSGTAALSGCDSSRRRGSVVWCAAGR